MSRLIIDDIIDMQEKSKELYNSIAKRENLEKLSMNELIIVYNATYIAYKQLRREGLI